MRNKKLIVMLEHAKLVLEEHGYKYDEHVNGYLIVNGVSYWSTKERFYDYRTNHRGIGLHEFVKYLDEKRFK